MSQLCDDLTNPPPAIREALAAMEQREQAHGFTLGSMGRRMVEAMDYTCSHCGTVYQVVTNQHAHSDLQGNVSTFCTQACMRAWLDKREQAKMDRTVTTIVKPSDERRMVKAITAVGLGSDGRCLCDCATRCPLGRTGSTERCTKQELTAAGVNTVEIAADEPTPPPEKETVYGESPMRKAFQIWRAGEQRRALLLASYEQLAAEIRQAVVGTAEPEADEPKPVNFREFL